MIELQLNYSAAATIGWERDYSTVWSIAVGSGQITMPNTLVLAIKVGHIQVIKTLFDRATNLNVIARGCVPALDKPIRVTDWTSLDCCWSVEII